MDQAAIREMVLSLHGEPFSRAADAFASPSGEPVRLPKLEGVASPQVDALVARCFAIVDSCSESQRRAAGGGQIERSEQLRETALSSIVSEALQMEEVSFQHFEAILIRSMLDTMIEGLDSVKCFDEVNRAESPIQDLARMAVSLGRMVQCVRLLEVLGIQLKERAVGLVRVGENLEHDVKGYICSLTVPVNFVVDRLGWTPHTKNHLQAPLNEVAPFIRSLVRGTRAIAMGSYDIEAHDPTSMVLMAARSNALRFNYRLSCNDSPIYTTSRVDRDITIHVHPNVSLFADRDAIGLILYNLIKNPIKFAGNRGDPYPSVAIECAPSSDGRCTSIYVRDDGVGISYDELRDTFSARGRVRLEAGASLNFVEKCLLSEVWAPHVPPVAVNNLLLDRGASVGGGTGIGLALAHSIISEGHQGFIQIYDHPLHGAGVQVLLPNVGSEVGIEERRRITLASLEHQLATALPT